MKQHTEKKGKRAPRLLRRISSTLRPQQKSLNEKCVLIAAWEIGYHLAFSGIFLLIEPFWSLVCAILAAFPVAVLMAIVRRRPFFFVPFLLYNFVWWIVSALVTLFLGFTLLGMNRNPPKPANKNPSIEMQWKALLREVFAPAQSFVPQPQTGIFCIGLDEYALTVGIMALSLTAFVYYTSLQYFVERAFFGLRSELAREKLLRLEAEVDRLRNELDQAMTPQQQKVLEIENLHKEPRQLSLRSASTPVVNRPSFNFLALQQQQSPVVDFGTPSQTSQGGGNWHPQFPGTSQWIPSSAARNSYRQRPPGGIGGTMMRTTTNEKEFLV